MSRNQEFIRNTVFVLICFGLCAVAVAALHGCNAFERQGALVDAAVYSGASDATVPGVVTEVVKDVVATGSPVGATVYMVGIGLAVLMGWVKRHFLADRAKKVVGK